MNLRTIGFACVALLLTSAFAAADNVIVWRQLPGTTQPSQEDRQRAGVLADQCYQLLKEKDLPGGEAKLRDAIAILPNKALFHFNLACILTARRNYDGAMDALERATDCGFTDFTLLQNDADLNPLRDLPRYKQLIAHKDDISHKAAGRALDELKQQFGKDYLYDVDEEHKLIFATSSDQQTLDALKTWLLTQTKSQEAAIFSHKPDEFIRVVVPSPADYHRMIRIRGVMGIYEDESRTLLAERLGQVMTHEFTHALHAADQRSVGQEHPVWLREGLASMYEAGEFVDGQLIPRDNFRLAYVQSAARRNSLIPFEKMLTLTTQDFIKGPNLSYGESSSLMLYLYEQKLLRKFYDQYKASYTIDPTGRLALEEVSGMPLAELQSTWSKWMLARKPPAVATGPGGPFLGVHFGDAVDGLRVQLVVPTSAASKAGLKVGDVIVGLDTREIRDYASFAPLLAEHKVGDSVTLKLRRDGKYLDMPVVLGPR